jgi:hypothetical protein
LSLWHIDPKHKYHNERACFYFHSSLAVFMIILILYGMCDSIIHAGTYMTLHLTRLLVVCGL